MDLKALRIRRVKTSTFLLLVVSMFASAAFFVPSAQGAVMYSREWQVPRQDPRQGADDVAVSDDGTVFVAMGAKRYEGRARIWKYSETGEFLGRFPVDTPWIHAIATDPDGSLLVAGNDLFRYATNGKLIKKWKSWGANDSPVYGTSGLSIDTDGDVYAAGIEGNIIVRTDRNGRIEKRYMYREKGGRPREFYDVAVAPDGSIYGTDDSYEVHHFARNGKHLGKFGGRGSGPGKFEWSHQISVRPDGTVYVMDDFYGRVQAFDPVGELLDQWGGYSDLPGGFGEWSVFGMDATEGAVYLLQADGRLQRFDVTTDPPIPAPLFAYRTTNWNNKVKAGKTTRIRFRAMNLGMGPATGVSWCVPKEGKGKELIVDSGCRDLGTIGPRSSKTFAVRVKGPVSKRRRYRIEVQVSSDQTGPGAAYSDLTVRTPNAGRESLPTKSPGNH